MTNVVGIQGPGKEEFAKGGVKSLMVAAGVVANGDTGVCKERNIRNCKTI